MFDKGCKFASPMNFFSHFLIDHKPTSPSYNVALVMPDLLRNFTPKSCKFNFEEKRNELRLCEKTSLTDFFSGCIQHIERDKAFHQSLFFEQSYALIRDDWKRTCLEYNIPKYWFSIHVLIEIMLDKYFIDNNLEKLTLFYNQLVSERNTVEEALELLQHPQPQTFLERYDRFCEIRYLFHYQDINRVAFAMHRIYMQIGLDTQWFEQHESAIVSAISNIYERWHVQLPELGLDEIQRGNESHQ